MTDLKLNAQCALRKAMRLNLAPTHRQSEIDRWQALTADVYAGATLAELAERYCISPNTARTYRYRILKTDPLLD